MKNKTARPSPNVEKSRFVPQLHCDRWASVERFILANRTLFYTHGSVVTEWRSRNGLRFGPYYRLKYREGNIQRSIYLGPSNELAQKVCGLLARLQFHRTCRRVSKKIRASIRLEIKNMHRLVQSLGYYMKGLALHKRKSPCNQVRFGA
ncbi:MAG: hypothetical protein ABSA16_15630 [Thermoguttaceae bacterium]|jgi:hypothetical protein